MKTTKLIIAISELWNDNQRKSVRNCLLKGIEEISKKVDINDIIEELNSIDVHGEIELDTCTVHTLIDASKVNFLKALKTEKTFERLLIVYVGPVSAPWGQWLLCDGIVNAGDVMHLIENKYSKLVMATLAPCDDWLTMERKHSDKVNVCSYDMTECGDPIALGLSDFVDSVCRSLKVTPCAIIKPDSGSFLKATQPYVCGFLDKSCSAMPCLVLIDGFSMLFNVGYSRNPEMRHHLRYIAQVDAALLSHVSYNNILSLSCSSQDRDSVRINHLFVPLGVCSSDNTCNGGGGGGSSDSENPYIVDLNNEMAKLLSGYKDKGTTISNVYVKGKSGTPVAASQLKPIPLFQKIGYGSLELVPLAPFEEDVDVKKCGDDLRKGKYINEGQVRPLPSSVSILLLWRPFNTKTATKRFLYVGPRSQLRKNLPAMTTALYNNIDCLKHPDHVQNDAAANKKAGARKTAPVAPRTPSKVNGTITTSNTDIAKKTAQGKEKTSDSIKKTPVSTKSSRPSTATVASTQSKVKEMSKRPVSGTLKIKSTETKKTVTNAAETSNTMSKKDLSKIENSNEDREKPSVSVDMMNGQDSLCTEVVIESGNQDGDQLSDGGGRMVSIGTVECAITEHGEADFCDDSPEEYSAEQMKELGLYDDDEDRSSAPLSDGAHDFDDADTNTNSGNMAHLPMEGSFYGKDTFEDPRNHSSSWQKPLGLPVPARESTSASKRQVKCATPIHVDCLCVPCDLDKEDLRCLFNHVRFKTVFLQVDKVGDVCPSLDLMMEEWGTEGASREVTVVPSMDDEASLAWIKNNQVRLASCKITVAAALSRCSLVIGGGQPPQAASSQTSVADNSQCLGYRCLW